MATSKEIKQILVEEFDYQKEDFVGENGKNLNYKQLEALLKKERKALTELDSKSSTLDEFDGAVVSSETQKFNDDDLITVMAGINGNLVHHSPVGNGIYKFNGFGQRQQMPYKELKAMNNLTRGTLEDGWIIILNKDIIKEFGLEEEYEHFLTPNKVDNILKMNAKDLEETIKNLPRSMKTTLIDTAKSRYNAGQFDSASSIKVFEKVYDVSFTDNLPLNDIIVEE